MVKPSWRAKSTATRCQPRIRHGPRCRCALRERRQAGCAGPGQSIRAAAQPACSPPLAAVRKLASSGLVAAGPSPAAPRNLAADASASLRGRRCRRAAFRRGGRTSKPVPAPMPVVQARRARRRTALPRAPTPPKRPLRRPCGSYPYPPCGGAGRGLLAGGLPPVTPRTTGAFPPARRRGARRRPSRQGRCGRRSPPRRRRACRDPSPARTGRRRACG